jgi:glycosyltransferase involved in cell wall biosynthesis
MNNSKRICLNMIVKNETPVLGRLFASVKDIISYYLIVDTGSTDGTPQFIKEWMDKAGIPGEVHLEPWVNFGHNRNQALEYAYQSKQADWVLLIDADEGYF